MVNILLFDYSLIHMVFLEAWPKKIGRGQKLEKGFFKFSNNFFLNSRFTKLLLLRKVGG